MSTCLEERFVTMLRKFLFEVFFSKALRVFDREEFLKSCFELIFTGKEALSWVCMSIFSIKSIYFCWSAILLMSSKSNHFVSFLHSISFSVKNASKAKKVCWRILADLRPLSGANTFSSRCQFNQNFASSFFEQNGFSKLFSTYGLAL